MKIKLTALVSLIWMFGRLHAQDIPGYTLENCRTMALENNKKIKAASFQIEAAKAAKKSVEASALPSVDGSVMGIHLGKPLGGAMGGLIPEYMANGSLNASLPIYVGGKIRNGKAAAEKGLEISQEQKNLTESDVLYETEKAYWQVVQVREKIVLAGKYIAMLESLEKDLQNSFDAGLIYKNDLLRVQVNVNEARLNKEKAEDGLVLSKLQLAQVIGKPANLNFVLADSVVGGITQYTAPSLSGAAIHRAELKVLEKALEIQKLQSKILNADRLPVFALAASGLGAAGKHVNIKDGSNSMATYYGIASISFPVFDWGKKGYKVKEQSFKIAAQQAQMEETNELINLEIQNAFIQLSQSGKKVKVSDLSLKQASENLRLANDRLKAGTITGKDVLEAQAIWQQANSNLIDSKIEYKINETAYKKAIGEINNKASFTQ